MKNRLSVIIASYNEKDNIRFCLLSLLKQKTNSGFQIIVVDSSQDNTADIVKTEFPSVRLLKYKKRKYCGQARNLGIEQADGEIIAFIDADCVAADDWITQILFAHRKPDMAVGGSIANQNPGPLVGWGAYFCEFRRYMPHTPAGWIDDMPGANISYKRTIFDRLGPFIEETYASDTEFHYRLKRNNIRIRFLPAIKVSHKSIQNWGRFIRHEVHHGWSYAKIRATYDMSRIRRIIYVVFAFLLPFKLLAEMTYRVLRYRIYRGYFLLAFPFTVTGVAAWCFGEWLGYLGVKKT